MTRYSFPYGVFTLKRYKKGRRKNQFYIINQKGQYVNKGTTKRVLKDIFGKKVMFRATVGNGISVIHRTYRVTYQRFSKKKSDIDMEHMILLVKCRCIDAGLTDLFKLPIPRSIKRRLTTDDTPPKLVKFSPIAWMDKRTREGLIAQAEAYPLWFNPDPNTVDYPEKVEEDKEMLKEGYFWREEIG